MTVGELITELQKFDDGLPVVLDAGEWQPSATAVRVGQFTMCRRDPEEHGGVETWIIYNPWHGGKPEPAVFVGGHRDSEQPERSAGWGQ